MTPPTGTLRLLIVDDSQSVRAVLRRFFSWTEDIEVVGEATDGAEAVAQVKALSPDVVLMDLMMPGMDGYAATERIMELSPTPIVVLSSRVNRNQIRIAFEAMRRGAVEVVGKPEDTGEWRQLASTLPEIVRTAAVARAAAPGSRPRPRPRRPPAPETAVRPLRWVGIGASTGGPAALRELLEAMPPTFPMSLLIVQHITEGFEAGLADWLNREFPQDVRLAIHGETPAPGTVRMAPGGAHLELDAGGALRLDSARAPRGGHRPAADVLLESLARHAPTSSAGVILTGMGSDGTEGLLALRQAGGLTIAQDAATSVVYGMPRAAVERGAVEIELSPRAIARYLATGSEKAAASGGDEQEMPASGAGGRGARPARSRRKRDGARE